MIACCCCSAPVAESARACPSCGHNFRRGRTERLIGVGFTCAGIMLAVCQVPLAPAVFGVGLVVFIVGRLRG